MKQVIYKIRNISNDKFYIGSTKDMRVRAQAHRRLLRRGKHHCFILQRAWDKHGEDFFKFEVIEELPDDVDMQAAEQKWLDEHHGKSHCYNTAPCVENPRKGTTYTHSEETRRKISEAQKGVPKPPRTDEHSKHLSESLKGNKIWLGKHHTDESRAKMGKGLVELTTGKEFTVMNDAVKFYGMPNLTQIYRQMKSGKPITRGEYKGLMFAYKGEALPKVPEAPTIPEEYANLPRTRAEAKATGAKQYFTGEPCKRDHISPRATKGTCIECRREDDRAKSKKPRTEAQKAAASKYYESHKEEVKARAKARPIEDQRRYKHDYKERQKHA